MTNQPSVSKESPSASRLRIVEEVEAGPFLPRFGARLLILLGSVIFFAGMLASAVALPLLLVFVAVLIGGDEETSATDWAYVIGLSILAVFLLWLGLRLARGRRRLVLFLRRFGFDDAPQALTFAVGTAMGRRWRLVTLADQGTTPVGVGKVPRRLWGWGRWLLLLLLVVLVGLSVDWISGGGIDSFFEGFTSDSSQQGGNVGEQIVRAVVLVIVAGVILMMIFVVVAVAGSALLISTLLFWRVHGSIRAAEGAKAWSVSQSHEVERVAKRVAKGARAINAPLFVVIKVTDPLWQQVVHALTEAASIVLIDVSSLSQNVLWEVSMLRQAPDTRIAVICRRDRAELLTRAAPGSLEAQICDLLESEDILAYKDPDDSAEMHRFAVGLGNLLYAEHVS